MSLKSVLEEEKGLLKDMLEILKLEKDTLIKDDVTKLQEIIKEKEELKIKLEQAENRRIALCGENKLKDILTGLNGTEREEIESIGIEMENLAQKIQEASKLNKYLISQSLNYFRAVINSINPKKPAVYKSTGRMEDGSASMGIINKSI